MSNLYINWVTYLFHRRTRHQCFCNNALVESELVVPRCIGDSFLEVVHQSQPFELVELDIAKVLRLRTLWLVLMMIVAVLMLWIEASSIAMLLQISEIKIDIILITITISCVLGLNAFAILRNSIHL